MRRRRRVCSRRPRGRQVVQRAVTSDFGGLDGAVIDCAYRSIGYNGTCIPYEASARTRRFSRLPSVALLSVFILQCLIAETSHGRVVVRSVAVLSADGVILSEEGLPSVVPSYRVSGERSSFVLDCDYNIAPIAGDRGNSIVTKMTTTTTTTTTTTPTTTGFSAFSPPLVTANSNSTNTNGNNKERYDNTSNSGNNNNNNRIIRINSSNNNIDNNSISGNNKTRSTSSNDPRAETRSQHLLADESLIVKWFRNSESVPLYQWIPSIGSRIFHHTYEGMIDPLYKHNDHPLEMFRAIRVSRPVRDFSGNFTCLVEEADNQPLPETGEDAEDRWEHAASHEILVYDPPTQFELHLNMSSHELRCAASTTESVTSVHMKLYRQDHDLWQTPLGPKLHLNATVRRAAATEATNAASGSTRFVVEPRPPHRIEGFVALLPTDVKVAEIDTGRTFSCELQFERLRRPSSESSIRAARRHLFERSLRIVYEAPVTLDGGDFEEVAQEDDPDMAVSWQWLALRSSTTAPAVRMSSAYCVLLFVCIYTTTSKTLLK